MIIDNIHRIVFVHIPKCAGTTVRSILQKYDSTGGKFTARVDYHPVLGKLDYVHIPLFILEKYFPEEFEKITEYETFAIVRNPLSRFASSISQRLLMYGQKPIHFCSLSEIKKEIQETINFLDQKSGYERLLPAEYIHFQRQKDYIYVNGERLIKNVYPLEKINCLIRDIAFILGEHCEFSPEENRAFVIRNHALRKLFLLTRQYYRPLVRRLPNSVRKGLNAKIFVRRDDLYGEVFEEGNVREFIENYYKEDFILYESLRNEISKDDS